MLLGHVFKTLGQNAVYIITGNGLESEMDTADDGAGEVKTGDLTPRQDTEQ